MVMPWLSYSHGSELWEDDGISIRAIRDAEGREWGGLLAAGSSSRS